LFLVSVWINWRYTIFSLPVCTVGLTLIGGDARTWYSLCNYGKAVVTYETNRRKTQEKSEILADELPAGKRTGSSAFGDVCFHGNDLRMVGFCGSLISNSELWS
jgi:hypothetical protein